MKARFIPLLAMVLSLGVVGADSPALIPFQGRLTDQHGTPYTDGTYTITFNLYDQAVGGELLWSERHSRVGVIDGMVNVFLGSIEPLDEIDFSKTRHLGILIDAEDDAASSNAELVPRQLIIPTFWARKAADSLRLSGHGWDAILVGGTSDPTTGYIDGGRLADASIEGTKITDGAVTAEKLGVGAVGSSKIQANAVSAQHLAAAAVGGSTIQDGAVSFLKTAARPLGAAVGPGGIAISDAVDQAFSDEVPGRGYQEVGGLEIQVMTTGRPVMVFLTPNSDGGGLSGIKGISNGSSAGGHIRITRDGEPVFTMLLVTSGPGGNNRNVMVPPGAVWCLDPSPAPGNHTYKVHVFVVNDADSQLVLQNVRLCALEL